MEYAKAIRLISYILIFISAAPWEIWKPRRELTTSKKQRWFNNLSTIAINPVLLCLLFPVLALAVCNAFYR